MKAYFKNKKIIEKHWYGNKCESDYILVEVLGRKSWKDKDGEEWSKSVILLPDGKKITVYDDELFPEIKSNE
jgi:hypothetical protein